MLEASPSLQAPALTELLSVPRIGLSALRLGDGAAIVKVEDGEGSVQIQIADGAGFDPAGGIDLRLPTVLDLRVRLRRTAEAHQLDQPVRAFPTIPDTQGGTAWRFAPRR